MLALSGRRTWLSLLGILVIAPSLAAQIVPFPIGGGAGGVYIDAQGTVHYREADAKKLDEARAKARNAINSGNSKDEKLCYISLPKLMNQVNEMHERAQ